MSKDELANMTISQLKAVLQLATRCRIWGMVLIEFTYRLVLLQAEMLPRHIQNAPGVTVC